jgi:hypothetical protein
MDARVVIRNYLSGWFRWSADELALDAAKYELTVSGQPGAIPKHVALVTSSIFQSVAYWRRPQTNCSRTPRINRVPDARLACQRPLARPWRRGGRLPGAVGDRTSCSTTRCCCSSVGTRLSTKGISPIRTPSS